MHAQLLIVHKTNSFHGMFKNTQKIINSIFIIQKIVSFVNRTSTSCRMNLIYPEFQVLASFSAELFQFLFRLNSSHFFLVKLFTSCSIDHHIIWDLSFPTSSTLIDENTPDEFYRKLNYYFKCGEFKVPITIVQTGFHKIMIWLFRF